MCFAVFLAIKHPEMLRAMILAEPPAVPLLAYLPGKEAEMGKTILADIQCRMVAPMETEFRRGDTNAGISTFMAYVFKDPQAWEKMPESSRQETLRNAREWNVMLTTGTLFPDIEPEPVRRITAPTLVM
jgi:hypothetical protein